MIDGPLYGDAILRLNPNCEFMLEGNDLSTVVFASDDHPSLEQIESEMRVMQCEYEEEVIARKRRSAYPSIGDQLDALYHAGVFPEWMSSQIAEVKRQFPKANET